MSLINQMLKDLEQRQAVPVFDLSPAVEQSQGLPIKRSVFIVLLLMLIIALWASVPSIKDTALKAWLLPDATVAKKTSTIQASLVNGAPIVSERATVDAVPIFEAEKIVQDEPMVKAEPVEEEFIGKEVNRVDAKSLAHKKNHQVANKSVLHSLHYPDVVQESEKVVEASIVFAQPELPPEKSPSMPALSRYTHSRITPKYSKSKTEPALLVTPASTEMNARVMSDFASAKLLVDQGNLSAALAMLKNSVDNHSHADSWHLAAVLAQKLGSHREASRYYSRLVSINPVRADYWLGLAMALDSLQETQAALHSYEQAAKLHNTPAGSESLNQTMKEFIHRRITALAKEAQS